jgi:isochorismate synthase
MRATQGILPVTLKETELLRLLLQYTFTNGFSMAAWKLPDETAKQFILTKKTGTLQKNFALEELTDGFIFSPFDSDRSSLYFNADFKFTIRDQMLAAPVDETEYRSHDLLRDLQQNGGFSAKTSPYSASTPENYDAPHYLATVEKGLREIQSGTFEKVVPSRNKRVALPESFDLAASFFKLCAAYPQAFVSLTTSPETGTWMGATPEELVRVIDKAIFKTVALAGTQPYQEGMNLRHVSWTQKEIEEQALVERYIISCFKKIRLREYDEHGPKTVVAGNLMHLRSDFTVSMKETNFPQLGTVMLQLLHPTSAVCGMPLEPSRAFLAQHEGYDRSYYSGFLGPVNMNNQINIFVNLRCMQIIHNEAVLYAGAGVTIDSVPEQEWEETEMKMNTLHSIIQ